MELVVLPFHDFKKWIAEGYRTRDAHLFQHFEKNNNVEKILVVNRPVSLAEWIVKRKKWKTEIGEVVFEDKGMCITQVSKKTYIIDFFIFDFFKVIMQQKRWWETAFKNEKVVKGIRESIERIGMEKPLLFLQNPMSVNVAREIGFHGFYFDAIDNWLVHPQMEKQRNIVKDNYSFINYNADYIFTVSENLKVIFRDEDISWIPNGVDISLFREKINESDHKQRSKRIGYIGKIQERVDLDLIESIARKFKDNEIFIYGPIYSQKKKIKKLSSKYNNLEFKGDVHYKELPKVLNSFDIGIIPHIESEFTKSMNPLKLYEYLAAGKPVVTTNIAGINNVSEFVYIAKDHADFLQKIEWLIDEYNKIMISPTLISSSLNDNISWSYKAESILSVIKKQIEEG